MITDDREVERTANKEKYRAHNCGFKVNGFFPSCNAAYEIIMVLTKTLVTI